MTSARDKSARDSANSLPPLPVACWPGGVSRPSPSSARAAFDVPRCARAISVTVALMVGLAGLALAVQGLWMPAKARLAQVLLERAFVQTVETGENVKPWSWADTWPIARIEVKRLNANA